MNWNINICIFLCFGAIPVEGSFKWKRSDPPIENYCSNTLLSKDLLIWLTFRNEGWIVLEVCFPQFDCDVSVRVEEFCTDSKVMAIHNIQSFES